MIARHSLSEAAADDLSLGEVFLLIVESGEVIEDYPNAYPTPACLVLGWAQAQIANTAEPQVRPDIGATVLQLVDEVEQLQEYVQELEAKLAIVPQGKASPSQQAS